MIEKGSQSELEIGGTTGGAVKYGSTPTLTVDGAEGAITWSVEPEESAEIDATGKLTPKAAGQITVKAHIEGTDHYEEAELELNLTIEAGDIQLKPLEDSYSVDALAEGFTIDLEQDGSDPNLFPKEGWTVSPDNEYFDVEVDGKTITITPNGKLGAAEVTLSHEAAGLYGAFSTTFTVNTVAKDCFYVEGSDGRTAYATLQEAYNALPASGGTIYVAGNPKISATLEVTKSISIKGDETAIIERISDFRESIISVNSGCDLKLDDITIDGKMFPVNAPAILVKGGSVTLDNSVIMNNAMFEQGGAVKIESGKFYMIHNSRIWGNVAKEGGAVYLENGEFYLCEGKIDSNISVWSGGAVYIKENGKMLMKGGSIEDNSSSQSGGGIFLSGTLEITGGMIQKNRATNDGGGVYITDNAFMKIGKAKISNNAAVGADRYGKGGGVYTEARAVVEILDGAQIIDNKSMINSEKNETKLNNLHLGGGRIIKMDTLPGKDTKIGISIDENAELPLIVSEMVFEGAEECFSADHEKFKTYYKNGQLYIS